LCCFVLFSLFLFVVLSYLFIFYIFLYFYFLFICFLYHMHTRRAPQGYFRNAPCALILLSTLLFLLIKQTKTNDEYSFKPTILSSKYNKILREKLSSVTLIQFVLFCFVLFVFICCFILFIYFLYFYIFLFFIYLLSVS
jgi:hypothetical protein